MFIVTHTYLLTCTHVHVVKVHFSINMTSIAAYEI